jgi:hypothetical protein
LCYLALHILTSTRTLKVLIIITQLFNIEAGLFNKRCEGIALLNFPLPCTKNLWRAESEVDWILEYTNYYATLGQQRTPSYNDVLPVFESRKAAIPNGRRGLLEDWMQKLDEFGMMTLTTAKFISDISSLDSGNIMRRVEA